MPALVIACGNPLRRDDGVAARVVELLDREAVPGVATRAVHQLTPELASDVAACEVAVFVDADPGAGRVRIARVIDAGAATPAAALTHAVSVETVVALARTLFAWEGRAFTCALPVDDLGVGEELSVRGRLSARVGARILRRLLHERE